MSRRVLVVDDDAALRQLFMTLLRRAGFVVECANDGLEGLHKLDGAAYSVVILDLMMPKVSGMDVIAELERSRPELLSRVIVTSGAAARVVKQIDAKKVYAVIRKPFDINELISAACACAANDVERAPHGELSAVDGGSNGRHEHS